MTCTFCAIAAKETPAHIVWETDELIAFLDFRPVFLGHVLLVPRSHHGTLADLPAELITPFFTALQALSRAVPDAVDALGTFVAMNNKVSQSVPHLHAHVVPRRPKDGLRGFFWPRTKYPSDREAASVATAISEQMRQAAER